MTKKRGFEIVSTFKDCVTTIPERATAQAAGYDFAAAKDVVIPSIWKQIIEVGITGLTQTSDSLPAGLKPVLVPTGIKAYMPENEYLQLCNRSSGPLKKGLLVANGVGVIDSDYYNNTDNEGHIMFQFLNLSTEEIVIHKGERIGQGIFLSFLKADHDQSTGERTGGFGSSGNE